MKTTVKQIASGTFIALLLMVGNVKATDLKASSLEGIAIETTLQMEKWMTNETIWNTNSVNIAEFVVETEPGLELENWMTNAEAWNANYSFVEEVETEMELEGWMTYDKIWNAVNNDKDSGLTVEAWMINENLWN